MVSFGMIVIENSRWACVWTHVPPVGLSARSTQNVDEPAAVGVPLTVPSEFKVRPDGNEPLITVNEYGGQPPTPSNLWLYGVPTTPSGVKSLLSEKRSANAAGTKTIAARTATTRIERMRRKRKAPFCGRFGSRPG